MTKEKKYKIAIDMHGGDNSPQVCINGILAACEQNPNLEIWAVGKQNIVDSLIEKNPQIHYAYSTEIIEMGDHPAQAIREKKDSSIVVGAKLVKSGEVEGFFSAGSTGACLAAATLITGRLPGIKRPAIGAVLPGYKKDTLLIDVGANADCKPEMLLQFAKMGSVYMKHLYNIDNVKVGLLNIGEEDTKGNELSLSSYQLLHENIIGFAGNCEGIDILNSDFDVVVCDGFNGNVTLKTIEGTAKMLMKVIKDSFMSGIPEKVAAALMKSELSKLKHRLDSEEKGGCPLLGTKGSFVIGHGSSGEKGIKNGILETAKIIEADLNGKILEEI